MSVAELTVEPAGIEDTSKATKARRNSAEVDLTRMSAFVPKLLSGLLICTYESAVAPSDAVSAVAGRVLSVLSARKSPNTAADTNVSAIRIDGRSARPHVSWMRGRMRPIRRANCVMFARMCGNQPTLFAACARCLARALRCALSYPVPDADTPTYGIEREPESPLYL